jgi:hypothetical protein
MDLPTERQLARLPRSNVITWSRASAHLGPRFCAVMLGTACLTGD